MVSGSNSDDPIKEGASQVSGVVLVLLVIVVLSVAGTGLNLRHSGEKETASTPIATEKRVATRAIGSVVYAAKNIPEGRDFCQDDLEQREELLSKIPAGAVTKVSSCVGGAVARYPIREGSVIFQEAVVYCPAAFIDQVLKRKFKSGLRAVTFGNDSNAGIRLWSHIDIHCVTSAVGKTKDSLVVRNVEVMALGSCLRKAPGPGHDCLTVLVPAKDVAKLVKAVSVGKARITVCDDKERTPVPKMFPEIVPR